MGYYTYFDLTVETINMPQARINSLCDDIAALEVFDMLDRDNLNFQGSAKWYDWEEDLRRLSEKYPRAEFELYGDGEESTDFWRAKVWNGKVSQVDAEICYPDYELWAYTEDPGEVLSPDDDELPDGDIDETMSAVMKNVIEGGEAYA